MNLFAMYICATTQFTC